MSNKLSPVISIGLSLIFGLLTIQFGIQPYLQWRSAEIATAEAEYGRRFDLAELERELPYMEDLLESLLQRRAEIDSLLQADLDALSLRLSSNITSQLGSTDADVISVSASPVRTISQHLNAITLSLVISATPEGVFRYLESLGESYGYFEVYSLNSFDRKRDLYKFRVELIFYGYVTE